MLAEQSKQGNRAGQENEILAVVVTVTAKATALLITIFAEEFLPLEQASSQDVHHLAAGEVLEVLVLAGSVCVRSWC